MAHSIRVILSKRVDDLGEAGSEHAVTPAYAQRVLLPQGLAVVASARSRAQVAAQAVRSQADAAAQTERARTVLAALSGRTVLVPAKASGTKLYGSVDAAAIVAAIRARLGVTLDPDWLQLLAPITTVGDHRVTVAPPGAASAQLTVTVSAA